MVRCLVLVNTYGNSPIKLLNSTIENSEIKINVLPLWLVFPNRVVNSLCSVFKILFHIIWYRDGMSQNIEGIISSPRKVLNQFKDSLKILEEGSNTENRLAIIFSLIYWLLVFFVLRF